MSFKINLKPSPGAEYFTVREHQRTLKKAALNLEELTQNIDQKTKELFGIPGNYQINFIRKDDLGSFLMGEGIITKDNPFTGIDALKSANYDVKSNLILDLSYSFPQLPSDVNKFQHLLIDPSISIGIPTDYSIIFTDDQHKTGTYTNTDHIEEQLSLIKNVLDDYLNRGLEILVRESNYKAAVLYQMVEDSPYLTAINEKKIRSKTIIVAACDSDFPDNIERLGYLVERIKTESSTQIAIANYATHSKEMIEMFADRVLEL